MIKVGDQVLITADAWFIAPNGKQYRAVFGTVHGVDDSERALGVRTNSRSTNWYVRIGDMLIAGCQIHYAVKTSREQLNLGTVNDSIIDGGKEFVQNMLSRIYDADESGISLSTDV